MRSGLPALYDFFRSASQPPKERAMERAVFRPLSLRPVRTGTTCRQPTTYHPILPGTPAIEVMTDFLAVSPATVYEHHALARRPLPVRGR
jgi:hypothetical protein